jgi:DNA-binding PadR family transcriptional regulator
MIENEFNCERAEAGDPRSAAEQRHRFFGGPGARGRRRMARLGRLIGHVRDRSEGFDPWSFFGQQPGEAPEFNELEEEGEDMRGDDRGHRGGRRHMRRRERMGFGWDFGGPQGHGPGHAGRPLEQGDLRWLTLDLIAAQPRHGYEIIKAIEDLVGGAYSPSPGVVYPTLTMLEELGHVTVAELDGKKLHTLTEPGRAYLEENRQAIEALQARMARVAATRAEEAAPPSVVRATENLKLALRLKLQPGGLTGDQARAIAAALDAAATAVEQA